VRAGARREQIGAAAVQLAGVAAGEGEAGGLLQRGLELEARGLETQRELEAALGIGARAGLAEQLARGGGVSREITAGLQPAPSAGTRGRVPQLAPALEGGERGPRVLLREDLRLGPLPARGGLLGVALGGERGGGRSGGEDEED
jgi:hypothetical protein